MIYKDGVASNIKCCSNNMGLKKSFFFFFPIGDLSNSYFCGRMRKKIRAR